MKQGYFLLVVKAGRFFQRAEMTHLFNWKAEIMSNSAATVLMLVYIEEQAVMLLFHLGDMLQ